MSAPRFCPACGTARIEGARFCGGCGADLGRLAPDPREVQTGEGPTPDGRPLPTPSASSAATSHVNVGLVAGIIGGGLILLGSFLPWMMEGDVYTGIGGTIGVNFRSLGLLSAGIGVAIVVACLMGFTSRRSLAVARVVMIVVGAATAAFGLYGIRLVLEMQGDPGRATITVGVGLYAVVLGGIVTAIGGLTTGRQD